MSNKNKLEKFAEMKHFHNVFQNFTPKSPSLTSKDRSSIDLKGKWKVDHFNNDNPLCLELACGKGDYTLGLARMYPDVNYIGVDVKGSRIYKGASIALHESMANVAFLRTRIEQITSFFGNSEVDEIWITFPDPFLKKGKVNRRLTSPRMLDHYRKILKPGGLVQLKTDSTELYEFTLETIAEDSECEMIYNNADIYAQDLDFPELEIKTFYEKMHLEDGRKIKYVQFKI